MIDEPGIPTLLGRIADALERIAPARQTAAMLKEGNAFRWESGTLTGVAAVSHVDLAQLKGIERQAETLLRNTRQFVRGLPANNVLLWGAKGTGKSSVVKAVHAEVNRAEPGSLVLVEVSRDELATLPRLLGLLCQAQRRFVLFCDDLSFESDDNTYKALKSVLDGGIEGRPDNVVVYATSNRRHLMSRDMTDNERSTAINPAEAVDEEVSLSDRFGLWLGFRTIDQETYLAIVEGYVKAAGLAIAPDGLRAEALEWAITRGSRSGRVAWQFVQDLRGRA